MCGKGRSKGGSSQRGGRRLRRVGGKPSMELAVLKGWMLWNSVRAKRKVGIRLLTWLGAKVTTKNFCKMVGLTSYILIFCHYTWTSVLSFTASICTCACAQIAVKSSARHPAWGWFEAQFGWLWGTYLLYQTMLPLSHKDKNASLHTPFCNHEHDSVTSVTFLSHWDSFITPSEYHWLFIINGHHQIEMSLANYAWRFYCL